MSDLQPLLAAGFVEEPVRADDRVSVSAGARPRILHRLVRDPVTVLVGLEMRMEYDGEIQLFTEGPLRAVIRGPRGEVSCAAENGEFVLSLAELMS